MNYSDPLSKCLECGEEIDKCVECYYDMDQEKTVCLSCSEGMNPTWRGDKCSKCQVGEFEVADTCNFCHNKLTNCHTCTQNSANQDDWTCDACFGEVPAQRDEEGIIQRCECDFV